MHLRNREQANYLVRVGIVEMSGETIPTRKTSVPLIKADRLTTDSGNMRIVEFRRSSVITYVVFKVRSIHNEVKFT
jgi:hypothetical protein